MQDLKKNWVDITKGEQFTIIRDVIYSMVTRRRYSESEFNKKEEERLIIDVTLIIKTILEDINDKKKFLLWGDYDVDGTCSVLIWIFTFKALGYNNFSYHIPDRNSGYGLSIDGLEKVITDHDTVITMDNGITAKAESEWCKQKGIKLIVTDHHTYTPENITTAPYVFNPKQYDNTMYSNLCGAGISYLICTRMYRFWFPKEYQDPNNDFKSNIAFFAAMGTICDFVHLESGNRFIFHEARTSLQKTKNLALKQLAYFLNLKSLKLTSDDFGFTIGPLINACGRMDNMKCVVDFFTSDDTDIPACLNNFKKMKENLLKRKIEESKTNKIINEELNKSIYGSQPYVFFGHEDFHLGIVGLSATKFTNQLNKPCLFYKAGDICHGSGRSIEGVNLLSILKKEEHLFESIGGHEMAFGFKFKKENINFINDFLDVRLSEVFAKDENLFEKKIQYDGELISEMLSLELAEELDHHEPFGIKFPKPVFKIKASVLKKEHIGKNKEHSQVFIRDNKGLPKKIMFFFQNPEITEGNDIEILVSVSLTAWRGKTEVLIKAIDSSCKDLGFENSNIVIS